MSLKKYLHQVRPREESYVNHVDRIQDLFITETVGERGLAYERKVHEVVKSAKVPGLFAGGRPAPGYSNQGAGDLEATYKGAGDKKPRPFNVEVKLSADEQMGGGSFRYDMASGIFTPVPDRKTGENKFDPDDLEIMIKTAKTKAPAINDYIKAARKTEPVEFTKHISGVPIKVSLTARDELRDRKLTNKIATNIKMTTRFIVNHYNRKGVYYIQVGGAGLFYMGKNPFKLDVPELKGEIQVEMGLRFAGGKLFFNTEPERIEARSASLRFQGRMITKSKSKYSLDKVEDVEALFGVR